MTGGELLVRCLIAQGVRVIFGIPGTHLTPIYEALYHHQGEIRHVLARHESGAAFMADGYARSTGDVGVCLTIPGPGVSNAHVGLGEASTDCVPVLLITSQNESHLLEHDTTKLFHGLDQERTLAPVTKASASVTRAEAIPEAVVRIFKALRTGRPRPGFLEISRDALEAEIQTEVPGRVDPPQESPAESDLSEVRALIAQAERPLILAGAGIHHAQAHAELVHLAERIHAPVLTTLLGKGAIPEDHPLSLGRCRSEIAREALESTDLLLAVGVRFTQMDTGGWSLRLPEPWVHIEADPDELGKEYTPTVGIAADLKSVLRRLLEFSPPAASAAWQRQIRAWREKMQSASCPALIRLLRKTLPREAIVAVDVHMTGYAMHRHFPTYLPGTFLYPAHYIAMGYALPAAIGARVAHPRRPIVALAGDGSFLMSSMELATVVQNGWPLVVLLSNDNAFTSIRGSQENRFGATLGVELRNPDFVQYARSFGIVATRVTRLEDFVPTMRRALESQDPHLLELTPEVFRAGG